MYKNAGVKLQGLRHFSSTLARQEKEIFKRDNKIHINAGTIGSSQHGKTSLVSMLTKVLSSSHGVLAREVSDIDNSAGEQSTGSSQHPTHLELWTDEYRYSLTDLPGRNTYFRNMFSYFSMLDLNLLIINPEEGLLQDALAMYRISKHYKIHTVPIISARPETEAETIDLVRMELDESGVTEPCLVVENPISGANPSQPILQLLTEIEKTLIRPKREESKPLYFPLEQVGSIPSRGTFCAGRIESGKIKIGSQLDVFYHGQKSRGNVKDAEIFRKKTDSLSAGDRGGVFIKLKPDIDLKRGGVLYEPGSELTASNSWKVQLKSLQGCGNINTKGEYVLFHSTFSDGRSTLEPCQLQEEEFTQTILSGSVQFLGRPGDTILLKSGHGYILGNLIYPA
ncbi:uncharacterized protein LOC111698692 [Eurytemora carolleeae]|uniref:uncharacterized protein LOC111698692 n=1 Tax=Eurytemora carolleeae TaxID=1294199 RepID=UPI000C75790F|nr:uncharacterized protein LOC111698692 [Eurytemora carolleeae]|eukprot:XP_023324867.1 uncharacterized protein LOC111698692 [Eurytemora affinis]